MKGIVGFLILICFYPLAIGQTLDSTRQAKFNDPWFSIDKLKHVSTAFFMTTTLFYFQNRIMSRSAPHSIQSSAIVTFSIGGLKELYDRCKKDGGCSWRDIAANSLGTISALLLLSMIK